VKPIRDGGTLGSESVQCLFGPDEVVLASIGNDMPSNLHVCVQGGGRTNKGSLHRPHASVKLLSVPVVLLFVIGAVATILLCVNKVIGSNLPVNYTMMEILAARFWCAVSTIGVSACGR
jgi:hypothetical protein